MQYLKKLYISQYQFSNFLFCKINLTKVFKFILKSHLYLSLIQILDKKNPHLNLITLILKVRRECNFNYKYYKYNFFGSLI